MRDPVQAAERQQPKVVQDQDAQDGHQLHRRASDGARGGGLLGLSPRLRGRELCLPPVLCFSAR